MSRLDELIQELCPNGVEYKTIQEVCVNICSGGTPKTSISEYYGGDIPWVRTQEVDWNYIYDTDVKITEEGLANSSAKWIPANCIIVAMYGATAAKVTINKIPVTTNQACCNLEINENIVLIRYVYHFLCNEYENLKGMGQGSQSNINAQMIKNYRLPVPPLEVQREIVRILDSFTLLTAELTAELTARKKQYEFYRDALLTFSNESDELIQKLCPNRVEYRVFGKSATIVRGASPRPIKNFITTDPKGVNWIKIGDVKSGDKYITASAEKITQEGAKKSRTVKKGDFILSNSMSFGRPYILQIDGCIHDGWLAISDYSDSYLSDFLYHLLNSSSCQREMRKKASFGGAVKNLNAEIVRDLVLPVPPLEVQREIVRILDSFTSLTTDLSSGLPAEIKARQKQYEYYRDKLLNFKKLEK